MRKSLTSALIGLVSIVGYARADYQKGSQTFEWSGGLSGTISKYDLQPGGSQEQSADPGYGWGGQYVYYFALRGKPLLGVGIDGMYSHPSDRQSPDFGGNLNADLTAHYSVIEPIVKLVYPRGRLRPYIFSGLGWENTSILISGRPAPGFAWQDTLTSEDRTLYDTSHNSFVITGAVGLDVFINETFFVGTEFRSTSPLYKVTYHPTSAGNAAGFGDINSNLEVWNLLFHMGIKFGGSAQ